jgi:hypothetical protein
MAKKKTATAAKRTRGTVGPSTPLSHGQWESNLRNQRKTRALIQTLIDDVASLDAWYRQLEERITQLASLTQLAAVEADVTRHVFELRKRFDTFAESFDKHTSATEEGSSR